MPPKGRSQPFPTSGKANRKSAKGKSWGNRRSTYKAQKLNGSLPPSKVPVDQDERKQQVGRLSRARILKFEREVARMKKRAGKYQTMFRTQQLKANFEMQAHKATVKDCQEHHVHVIPFSEKPFLELSSSDQVLAMQQFGSKMEEVRRKMCLKEPEFMVVYMYWAKAYGGVGVRDLGVGGEHPDPALGVAPAVSPEVAQDSPHQGRSSIWNEEWRKLYLLRSIADDYVVSSRTLRRIFLAVGIEGVNGGKLDRLKDAMNLAVGSRIRFHDITGASGENLGVWLEPADVIREMIQSASGTVGVQYDIVVSGDGR
jgi:hypothetical protein